MQLNERRGSPDRPGREGVALIIVLGLLAVLMMAGVAFSISMRTERLGAGSYRFGVAARNLVWAGLARAIEDISVNLSATNVVVDGMGNIVGYAANETYPNWKAFVSQDWAGTCPDDAPVKVVFAPDTLAQMPQDIWADLQASNAAWVVCGAAGGSVGGRMDNVQGRLAYAVANISGYLDANCVGGTQRWAGIDPKEIVLTNTVLTEIQDAKRLADCRDADVRYETIRDFYQMQIGEGLKANPENFVTFSRFPEGNLVMSNGVPSVFMPTYIGGTVAELEAKRAEILDRLTRSFVGAAEPAFVFTNLLDYIDEDVVPRHLDSGCTELVPMINEVAPTAVEIEKSGLQITLRPRRIVVEWFYPFINPQTNATFDIEATVISQLRVSGGTNFTRAVTNANPARPSGYAGETNRYGQVQFRGGAVTVDAAAATNTVEAKVMVRATVIVNEAVGGEPAKSVVDAVPAPTNATPLTWTVSYQVSALAAGTTPVPMKSLETTDPRVNWDCTLPVCWDTTTAASNTLDAPYINTKTQARIARALAQPQRGIDVDTVMYVSNRGRLVSVGELGNLLRASRDPLRTIRLFTHGTTPPLTAPMDKVLVYFTVTPPGGSRVRAGLVNPNTMSPNVLASVFVDAPLGYPESPVRMSAGEALTLANAFINARSNGSAFTNVADIGRVDFRAAFPAKSDVERESMIAYSCGLMSTRQNLFIVFVVAGPYSPATGDLGAMGLMGGDWHGYQRGMAVVWRDPIPNEYGRHPCFIQLFRWLGSGD